MVTVYSHWTLEQWSACWRIMWYSKWSLCQWHLPGALGLLILSWARPWTREEKLLHFTRSSSCMSLLASWSLPLIDSIWKNGNQRLVLWFSLDIIWYRVDREFSICELIWVLMRSYIIWFFDPFLLNSGRLTLYGFALCVRNLRFFFGSVYIIFI